MQPAKKPIVIPASTKAAAGPATVIFLHGLGDSGEGWEDGAELWQTKLPHVKFILPTASIQPVTLNRGMKMTSWHDIKSLEAIDSSAFTGIDASRAYIDSVIADEIKSGTAPNRIILGGFSQGGAMTLYTGLQSSHKLAGLICLSGYLPYSGSDFASKIAAGGNGTTPVFIGHGEADPVVNPKAGAKAAETLKAANVPVRLSLSTGGHPTVPLFVVLCSVLTRTCLVIDQLTYRTYPGMGHSSCPQEMVAVIQFLTAHLPPTAPVTTTETTTTAAKESGAAVASTAAAGGAADGSAAAAAAAKK